jgi:hypothetical protein
MISSRLLTLGAMLLSVAGCVQNAPPPVVSGPPDPNSVTTFTLALQPDSISGCILADSSFTRPLTVTVRNDTAILLTDGGIHVDMRRIAPDTYSADFQLGLAWLHMEARLATRPKRLDVATHDQGCKWAATAP